MNVQGNNIDLFGFADVDINMAEHAIFNEEKSPEILRHMYHLFRDELDTPEQALALLNRFCKDFGGGLIYIPKCKNLKKEIQYQCIWNEFTGNNADAIARKYDLSVIHVYRILKEMRQREIDRLQPTLF